MAVVSKNVLLEAGVHFGHQTKRWNPKMKEYIFAARDDIYIIDLSKTVEKLEEAYKELKAICENGGKVLFVGTKKQAQEASLEEAERSNSFYVTERWLGGTLTNFKTIRARVNRLIQIEKMESDGKFELLPKKEVIKIKKEYDKLSKLLNGIRDMNRLPKALIIVDPRKEYNAIREARKLNIPVFGVVDTNCDPDDVDYVIPGNDDAVRSVKVLLGVLTNAICEANSLPLVDYTTEEDVKIRRKSTKNEEVKEPKETKTKETKEVKDVKELKEAKTKKEEVKESKTKEVKEKTEKKAKKEEKLDYSKMTVTELKAIAKDKGIKGYSTKKKDELIELLK